MSFHIFTIRNPKYKSLITRTKNQIDKKLKNQISAYYRWRKLSWMRIESVWKQKGIYYLKDDDMNREEHEKLYQLFLIEDAEKLQFLLPMIEYYAAQGRLLTIDGDGELEAVFVRLQAALQIASN